jgi:hypothetical protein
MIVRRAIYAGLPRFALNAARTFDCFSSVSKRFVTRPVGLLFSLAFYIVVRVIIIVVCPARYNICVMIRRHYTAVVLLGHALDLIL